MLDKIGGGVISGRKWLQALEANRTSLGLVPLLDSGIHSGASVSWGASRPTHTVEFHPFIKRQLALRDQL